MDFSWNPDDQALFEGALRFAREELNEGLEDRLRERRFCRVAWERLGAFGLLGASLPESHGGMGLPQPVAARLVEAVGQGCEDMGLVFSAAAHQFACATPIASFGGEAVKDRVLSKLASGDWVGANAITEAGAGSDIARLETVATRDGDDYVLDGAKSYVTNGPEADLFLVYATLDRSHGYMGITAFAVERDTPGLTVGNRFETIGLQTSPIGSVYLEGCRVPASHRVGAEGQGSAIFADSMHHERTCLFAAYVGAMQRQLDRVVEHARTRSQFRRPIGKFQGVAHRVADMKLRLEAARLLLYRACWLRERGETATLEVSLAKLAISEAAVQSGLDAIQVFGGAGTMTEMGVERALRDAVPATIFSGTSEIQRDLIARELGL